jgi:hypothetical protein
MVGFPLLLIPLAVFNIIVFLMPGVSITEPLFRLPLMSATEWPITLSDMLLALGMLLLLLEVIKGARPGAKYVMDHLLSLVVFGAAAAEFVLWPKFGNSTFFLLTLLALVDFVSGIALRVRRSVQYALVPVSSPRETKRAAQPPAQERHIEATPAATSPAPASPTPANGSPPASGIVTEPPPADDPGPKAAQPAPVAPPADHSPQVASPDLQPSSNNPAAPEEPQR